MVVGTKSKRVLVVDGDAEYINACTEYLEADTFDAYIVNAASTKEQAASMLRQEEFDCVLIDNDLPDGDGMSLLEEVIAADGQNDPAAVMVTNKGDAHLAVQAMKMGAQDYLTKDEMTPEILIKTVRSAIENHTLKKQLAEAGQQFEHMALHDPLTGLANRTLFHNRLEHSVNLAERAQSKLAVLMIDMNGFKQINDTHGHDAGDAVLKAVAERLEGCLRRTDTLARLGGDEFAILLEGIAASIDTYHVLRRLLATCDTEIPWQGHALKTSLSIGFAVYPDTAHQSQVLLSTADEAMYHAKKAGTGYQQPPNFPPPLPIHQLVRPVEKAS